MKEALISEKDIGSDNERIIDVENKGDKFNKSGTTFSNISGNSSTKNGVRNFVGGVFDESKKNKDVNHLNNINSVSVTSSNG